MAEEYHQRILDVHAGRSHDPIPLPVVLGLAIAEQQPEPVGHATDSPLGELS